MGDAIRDDVTEQIHRFADRLHRTLDPGRYASVADGEAFDDEIAQLDGEYARLKALFHDYLLAVWSAEVAEELREVARPEPMGTCDAE
jgi:hypothetical protein